MAHVFQMMAGTSKNAVVLLREPEPVSPLDSIFELRIASNPLAVLKVVEPEEPSGRMCTCPVCRSGALMTLAELAKTPESDDEDGYVVPDVQIGATGIVMPGRDQLARWFRVPVVPKMKCSKLHAKAQSECKHHAIFTFCSTLSFQTVFFSPCLPTLLIALTIAIVAGYRSFSGLKKVAQKEDEGIKLELTVRIHAYKARTAAWEKLYYCAGCGMVHDREGRRSLPWYSMLQLVHYPEQEFESIATPSDSEIIVPAAHPERSARVA